MEVAFPNVEVLSRGFPARTWLAVGVDVNRGTNAAKSVGTFAPLGAVMMMN